MIEIETRLLEILDWDEDELERVYQKAAAYFASCQTGGTVPTSASLREFLADDIDDEGSSLIFLILDQNIRNIMRIIEE